MAQHEEKKGVINQIIVAIVVALLVGGTSPWWWKEIFSKSGFMEDTYEFTVPNTIEAIS